MRVAAVIARSDRVGGANIYVRDLALALVPHGIKTQVFVGGTGPFVDDLLRHGVPHTVIPTMARTLDPTADVRAYRALRVAVRAWQPDLVAAHTAKAGALIRMAGRSIGAPVVYTPHGWSFNNGERGAKVHAYRWLERGLGRLPATILHVSEHERQLAQRNRLGISRRGVVIPNGVPDVPPALRAQPARQPATIVSVARFEPPKHQDLLIRALSELQDQSWRLDLVGDGPRLPATQRLVEQLGMSGRVRFHGYRTDVERRLASSQIFALVTRAESLPLTLLEAMRAGLPVVATGVGGIPEILADDADGLLVPNDDHVALRTALRYLIERPDARAQLGAAARRRYTEAFSHDRMVEQVASLYRQLAGLA
ncbi:MAG: glycosyltransferase family 4 protein [Actinobacteria bacterium]|nr:glycosyltransferase family 4 protein [Actinomycetota bacterium]